MANRAQKTMKSTLTFHGGAGSVTGANFLLECEGKRLLVDCGTKEQEKVCDTANLAPFPYDPKTIDALFITHAHQDHIGRVDFSYSRIPSSSFA